MNTNNVQGPGGNPGAPCTATQAKTNDTPYGVIAPAYTWGDLLPLPAEAKTPPPPGFTGDRGALVTDAERAMWAGRVGNVALRLPPGVLGLDVDQYGDKHGLATVAAVEAQLGALPATWTSTSRDYASGSGIRLYRYPGGKLAGVAGESVEVIQHGHRYAVVWPSVVQGRTYRWHRPDGTLAELPPNVGDLAELPEAWAVWLASRASASAGPAAPAAVRDGLLAALEADARPQCEAMANAVAAGRQELAAGGARHDAMTAAIMRLVHVGATGHHGFASAVVELAAAWDGATAGDPERVGEFRRMVDGAAAKLAAEYPRPLPLEGLMHTCGRAAAPGVPGAVEGTVVDRRRVHGAMHAQAQFADHLAITASNRHMYVAKMGWHYYDGKRWREDADNARAVRALRRVLENTAAANIDNGDALKAVRATSSATAMDGVLRIARTSAEFARDAEDLDADPYALNVANGTIDLRTLELRPHDPADGITKVCRAAWTGADWRATRWGSFLSEVLPDPEVRAYLQRYVGLALVGEVLEHNLAVLTGTGRNGKGRFYGAVSWALGDYATNAEPDLFMHREGAHPTGMMDLMGARWVTVSETESGRRLADATVKRLTGGDPITARRMGRDFVEFQPSHTAVMITNFLPKVDGGDEAMWERLRVVPFQVKFPDGARDPHLEGKLRAEADAVLAWAVEGLRDYRARGMAEPTAVKLATAAYQENNDLLGEFAEERLEPTTGPGVLVSELHTAWGEFCRARRIEPEGRKAFTETLTRRGFTKANTAKGVAWRGWALKGPSLYNALSNGVSGVSGVFPVAPDIPNYARPTLETPQTPLEPLEAPSTRASQTAEQAAILARIMNGARA